MNKSMIALLLLITASAACTNEKVSVLTAAQKKARLDSVLSVQREEIKMIEAESLRDRMSIELKEKTDSILAERSKYRKPPPAPEIIDDSLNVIKDTLPPNTPL